MGEKKKNLQKQFYKYQLFKPSRCINWKNMGDGYRNIFTDKTRFYKEKNIEGIKKLTIIFFNLYKIQCHITF